MYINNTIQSGIQSDKIIYKTIEETDKVGNYPTIFLNLLDLLGLTLHILKLKISMPIIFSRNINQLKLCSGKQIAAKNLICTC